MAAIVEATNGFSSENMIGVGSFGPVYKGNMPSGEEIAVKLYWNEDWSCYCTRSLGDKNSICLCTLHSCLSGSKKGLFYESYNEDHKIVQAMTEIIPGLQGDLPANSKKGIPFVAGKKKVAACAKHFVGDGCTTRGLDKNNTGIDSKEFGSTSAHQRELWQKWLSS